jgi:hypothetical protein
MNGLRMTLLALTAAMGAAACTTDVTTPTDEPASPAPAAVAAQPSSATLVRLTNREYDNAVQNLLGVPGVAESTFPADQTLADEGFQESFDRYFDAADALGEQVWANPFLKSRLLTCTPSADAACTRLLVTAIGSRAFNGPMAPAEVDRLTKLATDAVAIGETPSDSIKQVVKTVLSSPQFLYQVAPSQQL